MSFLQTLEIALFNDNIRWMAINVGNVTHTVPMDTILNCPRRLKLSSMILHYCAVKDENPDKAASIFSNRSGQLFSHVLHYADTQHLVYPADLELTKTLVRDLCRYGLIRIKDGYCQQCLMDYFKTNGLDDFRSSDSGGDVQSSTYPFLQLTAETVIIQSENASGEIFALRAWGTPRTLEELFPKGRLENDSTYFQLPMCKTIIHTDLCEFLKQIADTVCYVVKKLGFRATCYSTWSDDSKVVHYGQWLLFRQLPGTLPVPTSVTSSSSSLRSPSTMSLSQRLSPSIAKLKKKMNWCPCFAKKDSVDIPMEYPDLPPKTEPKMPPDEEQVSPSVSSASVEESDIPPKTSAVKVHF